MIDWTNGWVLAGVLTGGLLLVAMGPLLFLAGCALADVAGPRLLKAVLLFGLTLLACIPLAGLVWLTMWLDLPSSSLLSLLRPVAVVAALLGAWVASALIYTLGLPTHYLKGLLIAGTELSLAALLATLVTGVVLVVLAVVQIVHQPSPQAAAPHSPLAAVVLFGPP
jgi:hypothetical protein